VRPSIRPRSGLGRPKTLDLHGCNCRQVQRQQPSPRAGARGWLPGPRRRPGHAAAPSGTTRRGTHRGSPPEHHRHRRSQLVQAARQRRAWPHCVRSSDSSSYRCRRWPGHARTVSSSPPTAKHRSDDGLSASDSALMAAVRASQARCTKTGRPRSSESTPRQGAPLECAQ
jgi:hypothetical protein